MPKVNQPTHSEFTAHQGYQTPIGVTPTGTQANRQHEKIAKEVFGMLCSSEIARQATLKHLVKLHNDATELSKYKLSLLEQDNFQDKYPNLNQWIEDKLTFTEKGFTLPLFALFAFSSGHYDDYLDVRDRFPTNTTMARCDFFRSYFEKEGTERGIKEFNKTFDFFKKYDLFPTKGRMAQLDDAKKSFPKLENVEGSSPGSENLSDYLAAVSIVDNINCNKIGTLASKLAGISFNQLKKIEKENKEFCEQLLIIFHRAFSQGKTAQDLIQALKDSGIGGITSILSERLSLLRSDSH